MSYLTYQASLVRIEQLHRDAAAQRLANVTTGGRTDRRSVRLARLLNTLKRKIRYPAPGQPQRGPEGATTLVPQAPSQGVAVTPSINKEEP